MSDGNNEGPATDRHNEPVVDPTKNVLDLVTAAIERQDDLRSAEMRHRDDKLDAMEKVMDVRFDTLDRTLDLIESRRVEQKIDTKVAVDAALSAAEKAVKEQTLASEKAILKSETSAAEQSKQQNATFTAALKGVTDLLADVKDRVVKVESRRDGINENVATRVSSNTQLIAIVTVVLIFISVFASIALGTHGFTK